MLTAHRELQTEVGSLSTQLHEWQQKAELWQKAEAARQTALEEKDRRHDELLAVLQSTLETLLTQHVQYTQQQADQAAATQQQWQQSMEQQKADTTAALAAQRDELLTALAMHTKDITTALATQHDGHTADLASLDSTVSQHGASIGQLLPLDEEVGSIRTVLDAYNEDISGLVERDETVRAKVEALRVESERLLAMASDVSGRCKRVESDVVVAMRAGVDQAAEWKTARLKTDARVDELSDSVKECLAGWVKARTVLETATHQCASDLLGHETRMAALCRDVEQLRHTMQRQHSATSIATKVAEEQKDGAEMATANGAHPSAAAVTDDDEASELLSAAHLSSDDTATTISAAHEANSSSVASPFLSLSPTGRIASTSLSFSSDSLLPVGGLPTRSHSVSLPTSPSDLSSVFPSVSVSRQAGVFTSPAKVVQSTQAMAWTINVKDGKGGGGAAVSTPPPRHSVAGSSRDSAATPRSAGNTSSVHRHSTSVLSASAGKSGGGGSGSARGSVTGSGRSSVSGSGVSSPTGKVSRQLAPELSASADSSGGAEHSAAGTAAADEQPDGAAVDEDDETY